VLQTSGACLVRCSGCGRTGRHCLRDDISKPRSLSCASVGTCGLGLASGPENQLPNVTGPFSIRDLLKSWRSFLAVSFSARYWIKRSYPQALQIEPQALALGVPYEFLENFVLKELVFPTPLAGAVLVRNRGVTARGGGAHMP
jgi:hypothetical protein